VEFKSKSMKLLDINLDTENVRKHSQKNLKAIKESLRRFGQVKPIVIDKNKTVIAGNGTVQSAKELGWENINVLQLPEDWDDHKIRAFAIADNRTAELAEWETELLNIQLEELKEYGYELDDLGFEKLEDPTQKNIEEFKEIDEDLPVDFKCPKCNYEWSGKQN
jgi:ParB-like chromosome segregation protein Spo0J